MIRIKGRNGFFTFQNFETYVYPLPGRGPLKAEVLIFSNSPHTQRAPVQFLGPPRDVARLLRRIAREIDAETRANVGATVKTKKEGKA